MKYCETSIGSTSKTNSDIIRTVYENMMSKRHKGALVYRPYTWFKDVDAFLNVPMDFSKIYPEYEPGDYAFITYFSDGEFSKDMHINIEGNDGAEIYFNGEKAETAYYDFRGTDTIEATVNFKEGKNLVIIKAVAGDDSFRIIPRTLIPGLHMGADGYVYNTMSYTDAPGYKGQEGMRYSRLYKKNESPDITPEGIDWVFPSEPAAVKIKEFDFNKLLGNGRAVYAYSEVRGKLLVKHNSSIKIFSDNEVIHRSKGRGEFAAEFAEFTPILIKSLHDGDEWGFTAECDEDRLSFAETDDYSDLHWLWIGPFGRTAEPLDYPYPPEYDTDFSKPLAQAGGKGVYWRFYRENTYLKQYLLTSFWGQWFYAIMVGLEGMRQAASKLEINDFYEYFTSCVEKLCVHRDYGKHDCSIFGWASYMPNAAKLDHLDAIGSFGMVISEYYLMTGDVKAKAMIEILAHALMTNVPRFPDGTFHRITTMWTDDMYMCLPFLARLGVITGEEKYFDEAALQIKGFYRRLYMPEQKLYSHIYFPKEELANRVPWGRGNGWVLLAISEVLMHMPSTHKEYKDILEIYRDFSDGVLKFRDRNEGIWHQVVNNDKSYIETSGSAMFITGLARGVKYGWLNESVKSDISDAWKALTEKCIDRDGNVYGVCMGSGCNKDEKYYLELGTITNDDHGVGIVLTAGVAVMNMLDE